MKRFIVLSFAFLAWGFYELSGGADFQPPERPNPFVAEATTVDSSPVDPTPIISTQAAKPRPKSDPDQVTAALTLASLSTDEATPKPAVETERVALKLDPAKAEALTEVETPAADLRQVAKSRVNMRNGPGRSYSVLAKLDQGDKVEVLSDNGAGWVKLRTEEGRVGWMAEFLLSAPTG